MPGNIIAKSFNIQYQSRSVKRSNALNKLVKRYNLYPQTYTRSILTLGKFIKYQLACRKKEGEMQLLL